MHTTVRAKEYTRESPAPTKASKKTFRRVKFHAGGVPQACEWRECEFFDCTFDANEDGVSESPLHTKSLFRNARLSDCTFTNCVFGEAIRSWEEERSVFAAATLDRVTFDRCRFIGLSVNGTRTGVKFLACVFDGVWLRLVDIGSGVQYNGSTFLPWPPKNDLPVLPMNYVWDKNKIVPAKGIVEDGGHHKFWNGNKFLAAILGGYRPRRESKIVDGLTFTGMDLAGADLTLMEFRGCTFLSCEMAGSQIGITHSCFFVGSAMNGAKMQGVELAQFFNCSLQNAVVSTSAARARFTKCNLRDADFGHITLAGAYFESCVLIGAKMPDSVIHEISGNLDYADLETARAHANQKKFLETVTALTPLGKVWRSSIVDGPRPTWTVKNRVVVRAWTRT